MRRIIAFLVALCVNTPLLIAALPSDTAWEMRPANGNDNNGGCYDTGGTGTDYSQQNTSQLDITDGATSGAGVTTLTSAAAGFTSAMVDNCIQITSGTNFTAGYYEITVFTNSSTVTLDRTPTAAGAGSGGVGSVGGARLTFESGTTDLSDSLAAGHTVHIKNEEGWSENVTLTVAGSAGNAITIEGYNSTRGDNPTGTSRPTLDLNGGAGDAFGIGAGQYIIKNIIVREAGDDGFVCSSSENEVLINVKSTANTGTGVECETNDGCNVINSELDNNSGWGYVAVNTIPSIFATSVHDNTQTAIDSGNMYILSHVLVYDNAADGLTSSTSVQAWSNITSDGNTGVNADGVDISTTVGARTAFINSILSNNGSDGFESNATSTTTGGIDYVNYFGNANAARTNLSASDNDLALNPAFTDATNDDFGVGAAMQAVGIPNASNSAFPLTEGYTDLGAVQAQCVSGSAGGLCGF